MKNSLPNIKISPEKAPFQKRKIIVEPALFRGYVTFRGSMSLSLDMVLVPNFVKGNTPYSGDMSVCLVGLVKKLLKPQPKI